MSYGESLVLMGWSSRWGTNLAVSDPAFARLAVE